MFTSNSVNKYNDSDGFKHDLNGSVDSEDAGLASQAPYSLTGGRDSSMVHQADQSSWGEAFWSF